MFDFITLLRALAAIIITNAHYEDIYPISMIANGGLLGDVMFFAISGFCLYKPKMDFPHWYVRRLIRIYPAVWIITLVYTLLGYYSIRSIEEAIRCFIFPTHYHFIRSIVILYVPYYFITYFSEKYKNKTTGLTRFLGLIFLIQLIVYVSVYNKSYYHIDSVYEPMIGFLFLEAMIIGAITRTKATEITREFRLRYFVLSSALTIIYFITKLGFTKNTFNPAFQIMNQYVLLLLMLSLFFFIGGAEKCIKDTIAGVVWRAVTLISKITLEIYLVQYALIHWLNVGRFPVNFMIVSGAIILVALLLHTITASIKKAISNRAKAFL